MKLDIQKAALLKRISAWIFDAILLVVVATGVALALSVAVDFDSHTNRLSAVYEQYEQQYGIDFDITPEELSKLTEEELQRYEEASTALSTDNDAITAYNMVLNLMLVILTGSILLSFIGLEILVPLRLQNGQTLGKKIFGVALMRRNGVKINAISLTIRTILGKFTIETMIPVLLFLMMILGLIGVVAPVMLLVLLVAQLLSLVLSRRGAALHDLLADTVAVDLESQMIFDSEEELVEYAKKLAAEKASRSPY